MIVTSVEHYAHRDKRIGKAWQRYVRISLRALIVLVLVIGSALGWIINRAKVQRDAVAVIERAGGSVKYHWTGRMRDPIPAENPGGRDGCWITSDRITWPISPQST